MQPNCLHKFRVHTFFHYILAIIYRSDTLLIVDQSDRQRRQFATMNIKLDAKKVVSDFGGMTKTARALTDSGHPITRDAVDKWRRASRIPSPCLLALALVARRGGQRFDIYDYIIEE